MADRGVVNFDAIDVPVVFENSSKRRTGFTDFTECSPGEAVSSRNKSGSEFAAFRLVEDRLNSSSEDELQGVATNEEKSTNLFARSDSFARDGDV